MDNIELILTDLGEEATKRLASKQKPKGLKENIKKNRYDWIIKIGRIKREIQYFSF